MLLAKDAATLPELTYVRDARGARGLALKATRWLRAINAERYMRPKMRHLDIGCGDGYFMRRSKCQEVIGLDRVHGDEITDKLNFPDAHFDYVTLLAVLDMFSNPQPLLREIRRVLKPDGRVIVTTPAPLTDLVLRAYLGPSKEQQTYITPERMRNIAAGALEIEKRHTFLLGLNQAFCLRPC